MIRWLRCHLLGDHDYYSYGPEAPLLKPRAGDSIEVIMAKFQAATTLRCRHCPYTYSG